MKNITRTYDVDEGSWSFEVKRTRYSPLVGGHFVILGGEEDHEGWEDRDRKRSISSFEVILMVKDARELAHDILARIEELDADNREIIYENGRRKRQEKVNA